MIGASVLGIVAGYVGRPLMFDLGGLIASPASIATQAGHRGRPGTQPNRDRKAPEMSHGTSAVSSPTALPRSSWGETLKRTFLEFKDDKLNHWGAALTYYSVLSLFPALLVLVSLIGLVGNPERVTKVLTDTVSELGPSTAAATFQAPIESITSNRGGAGIMFVVSLLGALWAASGYVSAFADASNTIYEVEEARPFWKLKPLQVVVTLVLILMAAMVALALVLSGPIVGALGGALGLSDTALTVWRYAKWPAMVALVLVIFGALVLHGPERQGQRRPLGHGRGRRGADRMDRRLDRLRALRLELRLLQQDLRRAGRGGGLPPLAVADEPRDPARGRVQRGDGARRADTRRGGGRRREAQAGAARACVIAALELSPYFSISMFEKSVSLDSTKPFNCYLGLRLSPFMRSAM